MWPSVSSPSMPVAEPDDLGHAERVAENPLDVRAVELRIAVRVQQALLGREQRARAVHLDRPAFEHDAGLREARHVERSRHHPANLPVEVERRILAAPRVVVEIEREPRRVSAGRA